MIQEQARVIPIVTRKEASLRVLKLLPISLLGGAILTVSVLLIGTLVVWLLNPLHLLGTLVQRLLEVLALPVHLPLLLLGIFLFWLLTTCAAFFIARPLAVLAYVKHVHEAQAEAHNRYIPLQIPCQVRSAAPSNAMNDADQEQQSTLLALLEQENSHQVILGEPGAGKTLALSAYQYVLSQQPWRRVLSRQRIPVYLPLKNYGLYVKRFVFGDSSDLEGEQYVLPVSLLDYLSESDQPGMSHLAPYWPWLFRQGRLLLLCDGLNEIDERYQKGVSDELAGLMRTTRNRVVLTSCEVEYQRQPSFLQLEAAGQIASVILYPLQPEQVHEFTEHYVALQDQHWQHTAGQIIQVIERSRLRYHCANPMLLFTLLNIIDTIGVDRGKQVDTRGSLLREYVLQAIDRERRQAQWQGNAPEEQEIIRFLSELASAARWAHDRNAMHLRLSKSGPRAAEDATNALNYAELADGLRYWLDEHPAKGPFETEGYAPLPFEPFDDLAQLIQFAVSAGLIEISPGGILSFQHELIAEYFVAEYFYAADMQKRTTLLPVCEPLLREVAPWSDPVALWAGLLDQPLELAERFGAWSLNHPAYAPQALALALVCIGVAWVLPEEGTGAAGMVLPQSVADALALLLQNKTASTSLASCITSCAQEGSEEVYQALFPLVMVEGIDELLALLDSQLVAELLFGYLQDIVDSATYEPQVKRLARVLGHFGHEVVARASAFSLPAPERSLRLRAAAINILGGTNDAGAVEPLLARLSDAEIVIVERATSGLIRLGPGLTLSRVLQVLEKHDSGPLLLRVHCAALTIIGRFLEANEPDDPRHISLEQYQRILDPLVPVLGSGYQNEGEAQQLAREILVRQGRSAAESSEREQRVQKLITALVGALAAQNEEGARNISLVLQEIGASATPALLELVAQSGEATRLHVIDILQTVRDTRALPQLLELMNEPSPTMQQKVASILQVYAPESIPGLLALVLFAPDELTADRAALILSAIGEPAVEPITAALSQIVPGRTRLLVQVLEQSHHAAALPALIALLERIEVEPLLAIAVVRALSQFSDARVVTPLLKVLSSSYPQLYEEAIDALSQLGDVALQKLLAALEKAEEETTLARIRRAILGMNPFPGEHLVRSWGRNSDAQAEQIKEIMKAQGSEAALVLVRHVQDSNDRVREQIFQTLQEMPGSLVVPALLETLHQPTQRRIISNILLNYPDEAIVPLVELLGETERGDTVSALLPQFGVSILRSLLRALDDTRPAARERAQRIIITLVRQSEDSHAVLRELIQLFNPQPQPRAREVLLNILSNELADVSLPILLEGMDDAYLLESVAEVFVRLSRKASLHTMVVETLLQALYRAEQRRGAATALMKIGAPVVTQVGELITDADPAVARIAREILREIGVPALSFIWSAQTDTLNPARREAALEIFHKMRTETIKDELVSLLVSNNADDIAMAVALLLERIHDEEVQQYADHVMVPELVEYIQTHGVEETNLRVVALLLMLGEHAIIDHLVQTLDEYPEHRAQLIYALLLLGRETEEALEGVFEDQSASVGLRAELAAVLGMMSAPDTIAQYAQNIGSYGMAAKRSGVLYPDELTIAHRALGGLLAGGHWNIRTLQELRSTSKLGSAEHELFSMLLGWRYAPQLEQLQKQLNDEREVHKTEFVKMSAKVLTDQKRIQALEEELEELQHEHGSRDDEMQKVIAEADALNDELEQVSTERDRLRGQLQRAVGDIKYLREQIYQLGGEVPERRSRPTRP